MSAREHVSVTLLVQSIVGVLLNRLGRESLKLLQSKHLMKILPFTKIITAAKLLIDPRLFIFFVKGCWDCVLEAFLVTDHLM